MIGAVLKTVERASVPWVRIPPPPNFKKPEPFRFRAFLIIYPVRFLSSSELMCSLMKDSYINISKAFSSSLVERIGTSTILNSFVPIKQIAEAKGLKSTRSLRLEINKPESKYISREVKVNGGTSYEILISSLELELQQKIREAEKINRYSLSFILVTQIFGRNAIWFSMPISERIIAIIAFQFYLWSAILE